MTEVKLKLIVALSVAVPVVVAYFIRFRNPPRYQLEDCLRLILASASIPAGIRIVWYAWASGNLNELDSDRLFIVMGGFALTWLSTANIIRVFRKPPLL